MNVALRSAIALCILVPSAIPVCMATTPTLLDDNTGTGGVLTAQAASDLFNSLDLGRPELAPVAAAWKRKDTALAERSLAEYFRTRTTVGWRTETAEAPPLSPQSRAVANAAVEGRLQGGYIPLVYPFPKGNIDWHFNPTYRTSGAAANNEWQWQLNRMYFWSDMAAAYRSTGDERYAGAFVHQLRSWLVQCPVPDHAENDPGSSWRTIEAGIRSGGSWIDAFYAFRSAPAMSDADLLLMVHSFLDHGRYLRKYHTRLNWLTMEMSGLYGVGAVFPELKDSTEWRTYAAATLAEAARNQFLPDGAQMELSTRYQNVALDNILYIAEIARWTGTSRELPPGYLGPIEKGYEWQAAIAAPDMHLPKINDSGPTYLPDVLRKAALYFPSNSQFRWFASSGRTGAPPQFTSVFLDRSGLAAMRSGWGADANYLLFRVGPLGMGHQHQDSLGVNVWAYGREVIFNSGGGISENSKWRQWAISGFAHNTVVVDNMAQTRPMNWNDPFHDPNMISQEPTDAQWQTNAAFDFAAGEYAQGYGPLHKQIASQRRDVLFLKPNIFVVADRMQPNDSLPHQFQARWQLLTTHSRIETTSKTFVTQDAGAPNIAVVPLLLDHLIVRSASGEEEPEILGWDFHAFGGPERVPATTLLHTLTGSGPHLILTLIVPLQRGEDNPIKKVEPGRDGISATAVFVDGRQLRISCPGLFGIVAQETLPDGRTVRAAPSVKP